MSKKLKLTKIELETRDGKKVELSIEDAKELHDQLHELFGEKYVPNLPIYIDRYVERPYPRWEPYCSGSITGKDDAVYYQRTGSLSFSYVDESTE